jgi:hypothetical protein
MIENPDRWMIAMIGGISRSNILFLSLGDARSQKWFGACDTMPRPGYQVLARRLDPGTNSARPGCFDTPDLQI